MKSKIKLSSKDIGRLLDEEPIALEKYVAPILNLANQIAQGTRPRVVGQMTEMIQQFQGSSLKEWEEWYLKEHPEAIENASRKILEKVNAFKEVINSIDKSVIERWVRDLVIVKSYIGLRFQEAILKKGAELLKTNYSMGSIEEEAKGIDGYIGGIAVSIKPETYKTMTALHENISHKMIYYSKDKDGVSIDFGNLISDKD